MFIYLFVRFKRISKSFNKIKDRIHLSGVNVYQKIKVIYLIMVTVNVLTDFPWIFLVRVSVLENYAFAFVDFCFIFIVYILNIELIIVDVVWVWFSAVDDVVCRNTSFYIQYLVSGNICFCFNARRLG